LSYTYYKLFLQSNKKWISKYVPRVAYASQDIVTIRGSITTVVKYESVSIHTRTYIYIPWLGVGGGVGGVG
jgi:hypothetical protein